MAATLASIIPVGACGIPHMIMTPFRSTSFEIEARLVVPSASGFVLSRVPLRMPVDRPLELELSAVGLGADVGVALSVASWISANARLVFYVNAPGQPQVEVSLLVKALPSGGGWIIRALARPAAWADAASVTIKSLSLAGQPLPCDCLPATLRVGYNHKAMPAGAVLAAAQDSDVEALEVALSAGGSTEEAANGCTAFWWAALNGHLEALRMLLEASANPAAADRAGVTPLHVAAINGHTRVVALLLATPGVDPLAKDRYSGMTPLDRAQSSGRAAVAALLRADPRVAVVLASAGNV